MNDPDLPRVVDDADLISDDTEEELCERIEYINDEYRFDVVIVTTDSIDGAIPMEYADDFYDYNGYGAGPYNDGILLLVSMEDRDWWISTAGYGIDAFTDYGIDVIGDTIVPDLSDGNYDSAFSTFLDLTEDFLNEALEDTPYDVNHKYKTAFNYVIAVLIGLGIGLVIAIIVVLVMKSKMKSVVSLRNANNYIENNSLNIKRSNDIFLYKNVTKTKKPEPSSSGGSSTHSSSSGSSHGGGGGKF
ncbi:TPM domain-containing protein [Porcipelethomonas sp.]|uniref:TPM domain-containing protein n=1 Tax=Porcipelethomonas sp. TaxID=2981675 RepID=UPI003EF4BDC2